MQRAVLLFNPSAGRANPARAQSLENAAALLREHGIEATIISTRQAGSAGEQAAAAIASGADTIFACGGDGTLHDVIQGVAAHPEVAVGVLPLGSANALARHLGLSRDPVEAVHQQLEFTPQLIPLGRVTFHTRHGERSRYFAVMAGAGPDGALVYKMLATGKQRLGRTSYYLRAAGLFLQLRFAPFRVSATRTDGPPLEQEAVSAMALRVGDLGGLFSPLAIGAAPTDELLQLILTAPPAHVGLPAWFALSWARLHRWNPYSQRLQVTAFSCSAGQHRPVRVQADGEFLGYTPMWVELVPNALRLLMPTSRSAR